MIKRLLIVYFFLCVSFQTYAQTNDECKYFQVLAYVKLNSAFNENLKKYLIFDTSVTKVKFVELGVSPRIEFIEITEFKDRIANDSVGINRDVFLNDRLYYKTYNFNAYESFFLQKVLPQNDSSILHLTFSKVIGKTLLVEILNSDNSPGKIRKIGEGVKILFIFDESGAIKRTYINKVVYN